MKYLFLILLFFSVSLTSYSQVDFEPKGSFVVDLGLPNNISNKAFKELVQGLAVINPGYQYTFQNTLAISGGLRYGYFSINEFKNNINLKGGMHLVGAWAKIGQEKFYGNFGLDYGVRIGYSTHFFTTNKNKQSLGRPYNNDGAFVEPVINFALKSGENSSFSLTLSYAIHSFKFEPEQVGIDQFVGFKQEKLNSVSSYFSIGFGYSYYFGKK